jgi:hypothetical protein
MIVKMSEYANEDEMCDVLFDCPYHSEASPRVRNLYSLLSFAFRLKSNSYIYFKSGDLK